MEEKNATYLMFESAQARSERTNRRLWILNIILIAVLLISNGAWIWYESQWRYVESSSISQEVESDEGGTAVINDGVHINGESKTNGNNN